MQISLNTYSLRKELASGDLNFDDSLIDFLTKNGINGLEIWANHMENQGWDESNSCFGEFKDKLKEHAIEICALCVEHGITESPIEEFYPDKDWRQSVRDANMERMTYGEIYMEIATEFNIPFVRFCYGPGWFGYKVPISEALSFNVELAKELYQNLCTQFKSSKSSLCIENHSYITADPVFIGSLLDAVPKLKVTLDLGNLPDDKMPFIKEVVKRGRLGYVHAKMYEIVHDPANQKPKEKFIDYEALVKVLKNNSYDGIYSIEWAGKEDAKDGITKAAHLLKSFM